MVIMADYKSILVKNNTTDNEVTIFIYRRYDPVCWVSSSTQSLPPGTSKFYRSKLEFKFKINASKKTVLDVRKWTKNTYIEIYDREVVKESDLGDNEFKTAICSRKVDLEGRDLYAILKLDMKDVRKLEKDMQDEVIKNAFVREICRHNTDITADTCDKEMVLGAYYILGDRGKRAKYHNKIDYSSGWCSKYRWKSVFWTECETTEQKSMYEGRLVMAAASLITAVGGLSLSVFTAGAATPAVVAACKIIGTGYYAAGIQSFFRLVNQESTVEGVNDTKIGVSHVLGFAGGVVAGGASVCLSAGITGIGTVALQKASVTSMQLIGMGVASGATRGTTASLAADAEKKLLDGEDLTWKHVLGHAVKGAAISSVSGALVEVSSENIERSFVPGLRRVET